LFLKVSQTAVAWREAQTELELRELFQKHFLEEIVGSLVIALQKRGGKGRDGGDRTVCVIEETSFPVSWIKLLTRSSLITNPSLKLWKEGPAEGDGGQYMVAQKVRAGAASAAPATLSSRSPSFCLGRHRRTLHTAASVECPLLGHPRESSGTAKAVWWSCTAARSVKGPTGPITKNSATSVFDVNHRPLVPRGNDGDSHLITI
jgi:hypothetical protein